MIMKESGPSRAFECRRCGECCRVEGIVRLREGELEAMASYLGMTAESFADRFTRLTRDRRGLSLTEQENGACSFLEPDGLCRVQTVKPAQCRSFPTQWAFRGYEAICRTCREDGPAVGRGA